MANSTIQQHQPLRVPRNWNTQEKALIVQLDEVFDDIYRRFGRLRIEDMGDKFRKRFEDAEGAIVEFEIDISGLTTRVSNAEGDITDLNVDVSGLTTRVTSAEGDIGALDVRAGNIEIAVGNKYDKVAGITIDTNGIGMTGKNITLNAGSSVDIKTGGTFTVESGQFSIDSSGNASFGGNLSAPTGTIGGFTIGSNSLTATDFIIDTTNKRIKIGKWRLNRDGLFGEREPIGTIGECRFALGAYGIITSSDMINAIESLTGQSTEDNPQQSIFISFKTPVGESGYVAKRLIIDKVADPDVKVQIRADSFSTSTGISNGGGQLGLYIDRWKYIYVDTINYLTLQQGSSRDIKHDIRDMPAMGDRLDSLKPVTFVYDEDTEERTRYGLIYEDTVETMPEICTGSEENKAINYIELIPMLLKEIQELRTRVSDLEGRN